VGQAHGARRQAVACKHRGKTESGVVSVSSLLAEERVYYPVDFEPYTPSLITSREASKTPHFAPSS
jgi:hypothetical protein